MEQRFKIIQLDEFMITNKTQVTHSWANKKKNIFLEQGQVFTEPLAVIMAVSREKHGIYE